MTWQRQVSVAVAVAVAAVLIFTTGTVHEAAQYVIGVLTGACLGYGLAKR